MDGRALTAEPRAVAGRERADVIQTVLGPIEPAKLGITQTHEHLLIDLVGDRSSPATNAKDLAKWDQLITLENSADVRRHADLYRTAARLESVDDAVAELGLYRDAGGRGLVDCTSGGLRRDPLGLREISRRTGVHVVMGCGYYVKEYHPPSVATLRLEEITEEIIRDLTVGVDGIVAGLIGEIGLTWPTHPDELKVLRAAARAQRATGAALSIHPGRNPAAPMEALRVIETEGADLRKTIMGHLDRTVFEFDGFVELAKTGCTLEFDLFGWEQSYYRFSPIDMPNDAIRINYLVGLIERGYGDQLVVGEDVGEKLKLRRYGGVGYDHILTEVLPVMRRKGMSEIDIDRILAKTPARLLARLS